MVVILYISIYFSFIQTLLLLSYIIKFYETCNLFFLSLFLFLTSVIGELCTSLDTMINEFIYRYFLFLLLLQTTDELRHQIANQQKVIEQHKSHINKCIDVVKKLLKEKSNIEKKEARQKCMQNRLRLGQFVTQRVGATFQENWTDGYAFHELARRQEEIATEREEIDKQKKLLLKKRPSNSETGRKRSQPQPSLHNGTEATFLKPDAVPGSYTWQEYYEADEILKVHRDRNHILSLRIGYSNLFLHDR